MAARPIEAESLPVDCEGLPTRDYVLYEHAYQNKISQKDRQWDRHPDRNPSHQLAVPGYEQERERQPVYTGMFNGDSSHHAQPSSYFSEPPHSGGFRSGFQSQPSSSIGRSMERNEQFRLASIQKQSHLNIEGSRENYSSSSLNGNNITCHPSSYDQAAHGMASQDASLGNKHKVVLLNNSAVLKQLNHPHTNQHVYHDEINNSQDSALQRNAERNPLSLRNEQLNQQNGMANQSVHSLHGQPASVDQPEHALLDQPASGIQSQHPRPLSIRNNHLNQQNGTVNQSIEGLPVRITAATPNMEARQLRNEIPFSAHINGGVVEVNQCTSFGQEPLRMPQKKGNAMSLHNAQMNRENLINQSVAPELYNQTPSVVARHSLYRDQGDQESGNTFNQHGVLQGPPQNSQQLRNQGDQRSLGNVPFHGYNQHGVLQGPPQNSQEFRNQGDQGSSGNVPFHGHNQHEVSQSSSHRNGPQLDNSKRSKKVFIVYFNDGPIENSPVLKLALCLRRMDVDVTADFFEYDNPPNSWPIWYEQKIKDSNVVLCIITKNFYHQLTNGNHVVGYSVYNLMNSSRNIAFRAVFIDAEKREMMEYVPPAMQGATSYSISSNRLTPNDEEFANLYAFLTGQNRVEKPPLGKRIVLAPKKGRCKSQNFKNASSL